MELAPYDQVVLLALRANAEDVRRTIAGKTVRHVAPLSTRSFFLRMEEVNQTEMFLDMTPEWSEPATILQALQNLIDEGLLYRDGRKKGAYWVVVDD